MRKFLMEDTMMSNDTPATVINGNDKNSNDKNGNDKNGKVSFFEIVCAGAVICCIIGMIICCVLFCVNTFKFSKYAQETLSRIDLSTPEVDKEAVKSMIKNMESIIAIQKSGMTNDVMSFIYGILSTILVGLCAGFVVKSRNNADETKKTVEKVIESAGIAKSHAEKAEGAILQAQTAAERANELQYQSRLIIIMNRLLFAKSVLQGHQRVLANREISQTQKEIASLFSEDEFIKCRNIFNREKIDQVYGELHSLGHQTDVFLEECKQNYSGPALQSMEDSAKNYQEWINEAIGCIDNARNSAALSDRY